MNVDDVNFCFVLWCFCTTMSAKILTNLRANIVGLVSCFVLGTAIYIVLIAIVQPKCHVLQDKTLYYSQLKSNWENKQSSNKKPRSNY